MPGEPANRLPLSGIPYIEPTVSQRASCNDAPTTQGLYYLNDSRHLPDGAESAGIQHRDVKPQNLLLVGGRVKVGDFGLARVLHGTETEHTGSMTVAYAAPEFFRRETSAYSYQYSLAVAYCFLRGGRLPFSGSPEELMAAHLHERPDLSMLSESERPVVARALAKNPEARWPSCRAFVEELSRAESPTQSQARRRALSAFVVVGILLALDLAICLKRHNGRRGPRLRRSRPPRGL